ncbi:hypothetical protein NUW54_g4981 [Trametes sanguinea]|uniref:Uncharacterized protein n=1 Tax=Trametes sanguinea TaxID=158606 RepID=A0ACC1PZV0_9APHY|nr:hypothetical protein NUW54_g4981 [Trametes sanguinea]
MSPRILLSSLSSFDTLAQTQSKAMRVVVVGERVVAAVSESASSPYLVTAIARNRPAPGPIFGFHAKPLILLKSSRRESHGVVAGAQRMWICEKPHTEQWQIATVFCIAYVSQSTKSVSRKVWPLICPPGPGPHRLSRLEQSPPIRHAVLTARTDFGRAYEGFRNREALQLVTSKGRSTEGMHRTARAQHAPGALQEAALLPRSCCSCLIAAVWLTRLRALLSPTGQQFEEGWPALPPPYYPPYLYPCQHVSGLLRRPSAPIHLDRLDAPLQYGRISVTGLFLHFSTPMSSSADEVAEIIAFYESVYADAGVSACISTTHSLGFGPTAFLTYEYLITFDCEVGLFWRSKFTGASALFLTNRYWPLLVQVLNIASSARMSDKRYVGKLCSSDPRSELHQAATHTSTPCKQSSSSNTSRGPLPRTGYSAFSALRTFALSRGNWAISTFVFLLSMVPLGVNFVGFHEFNAACVPLNALSQSQYHWLVVVNDPTIGCSKSSTVSEEMAKTCKCMSADSSAVKMNIDVIVLLVTWMSTYGTIRLTDVALKGRPSFVRLLVRDGTIYFTVLLILNTLHLTFTMLSITDDALSPAYAAHVLTCSPSQDHGRARLPLPPQPAGSQPV